MKLSEAIIAGAVVLKTTGPSFKQDIWVCAQAATLGREPTPGESCAFYWNNPWMKPGDMLEFWARLIIFDEPRWFVVVSQLKQFGG